MKPKKTATELLDLIRAELPRENIFSLGIHRQEHGRWLETVTPSTPKLSAKVRRVANRLRDEYDLA